MKLDIYITNSGKLIRKNNLISFLPRENNFSDDNLLFCEHDPYQYLNKEIKELPIENIQSLYIMSEVIITKKLFELSNYNSIPIHFYNFYNQFIGSFFPANLKFDGDLIIKQVKYSCDEKLKLNIATKIILSAINNLVKNLIYYSNRGRKIEDVIEKIKKSSEYIVYSKDVNTLMLIEAKIRKLYYSTFNQIILSEHLKFIKREFNPPKDEINALISFLNSLLYNTIFNEMIKTPLHPAISFIHSPGNNRLSLIWDIAEIFKPIITDRIIFGLINRKRIFPHHFDKQNDFCYLNSEGRKIVLEKFNEKVNQPISFIKNEKATTIKTIIRNECYKLIRLFLNNEPYHPFKINW